MSYLTLKCILNLHIDPYFILNLCESLADNFVKSRTIFWPGRSCATIYTDTIYTYAA